MDIDNLAGIFSQKSGVQQSMGNTTIGFMAQKMMGQGLGNMLSGGGGSGSDHELVRHVQQNAGIKDPETARQYTQQGVDVLNEQSRSNPQGLQSLMGGFLGGGAQQRKGGGGGLGGMVGDVLGG